MTQDFAKIRPEPILERTTVEQPSAWLLMGTGVVVGLAIGVFACVLFYLSGNVPPLTGGSSPQVVATAVPIPELLEEENPEELQLEFYTALREYEVEVDATPVEIIREEPLAETQLQFEQQTLPVSYLLQTGAFEQQDHANSEMRRLQALGLQAVVRSQSLIGSTLYLVQSGPYDTNGQLHDAEQLLLRNNIDSMRLTLQ